MADITTLHLSGQKAVADQIKPKLDDLKAALAARRDVFNRIPENKKRQWIEGGKDPLMVAAWDLYQWLKDFFKEVDNGA